jgi:hypothetical protein
VSSSTGVHYRRAEIEKPADVEIEKFIPEEED